MPGYVATFASPVLCSHAGKADPTPPAARVFIMGVPVVTTAHLYTVKGCGLAASGSPPCVTGMFTLGTVRVMASYAAGAVFPLVIAPGTGLCQPTPQPLLALPGGQARVFAV